MFIKYPRGSIFWATTSEKTKGSVQKGTRPVLIISNDTNNIHSPVVTVVSLTSQTKTELPVHVIIPAVSGEGINTILCEQIKTIPKTCLRRYCSMLPKEIMLQVDKALAVHLNIPMSTPSLKTITTQKYTDAYKKQYLADAEKMSNAQLAKKYNITAKAALARTTSWSNSLNKNKLN